MTIKSNSATCDDCGDMGDVQREEHLDRSVCEVCYEDYCAERFCYECESWNSYIINAWIRRDSLSPMMRFSMALIGRHQTACAVFAWSATMSGRTAESS